MSNNFFMNLFRSMWKNRSVSLINIAGLSVRMTADVLILQWVQNEIGYDRDQPNFKQIFRMTTHITVTKVDTWIWDDSPYPLAGRVRLILRY